MAIEGVLRKIKQFDKGNFQKLIRVAEVDDEMQGLNKVEADAINKKKKELLGSFNELNN